MTGGAPAPARPAALTDVIHQTPLVRNGTAGAHRKKPDDFFFIGGIGIDKSPAAFGGNPTAVDII